MGRKNTIINGGFRHIINNKTNKIDSFITDITKLSSDEETQDYINTYSELTNRLKPDLLFLSNLEELIIQKTNMSILSIDENLSGISLTKNNGYMYARHPFYKNGGEINDIRVIMCKITPNLLSIDELKKDIKFMKECSSKLCVAMLTIIDNTQKELIKNSGILIEETNDRN
jgi:hypothetical protein